MNKTIVVNLFGGPSIGKSTTAAGVFALLKLHGVECEIVPEFAKDLVWEERFKTFENQHYIFGKQYHRLWRLRNKVNVVVTDCPLLLSVIYGLRYKSISEKFIDNVIDTINTFDNYNILLTRVKKYNQNGRNETEEEAKEVDLEIRQALVKYRMPWMEIPGNYEAINEITKKFLEQEQVFKIVS